MKLKNFYDAQAPSGNLVTTITGIVTLIISILVGFGVLTPEQSTELSNHAMIILQAVVGVWGAISAIILMFKAKDN